MGDLTSGLDPRDWDPRDPSFRHDPMPWYRALREQAPVHHHPDVGYVLSRHADIERLLRDDRFGVATPSPWREAFASMAPPSMRMISENMLLFADPPQHSRVRSLVAQAFTPRRVEALRPRLTEMIDRMLDDLEGASSFDVIDEIAGPFPIMAITELHGQTLEPGTAVRLLLGSANRDPEAFDDPDRFDIHRVDGRHLAFGKGIHFCIGAALGRLEGEVVIPAVLQQFPHLSLVDAEPTWRASFVTRQLAALPVNTVR